MLQAGRVQSIERAVQCWVRHRADVLGEDRGDIVEWLECSLSLVERTGPARNDQNKSVAMALFRDEGERRCDLERREGSHLLRGVGDVLTEEAQDVARVLELIEHRSPVNVLDRVELELKGRDYSKVATTSAEGPEEFLVLLLAGDQELAVGRDHVG